MDSDSSLTEGAEATSTSLEMKESKEQVTNEKPKEEDVDGSGSFDPPTPDDSLEIPADSFRYIFFFHKNYIKKLKMIVRTNDSLVVNTIRRQVQRKTSIMKKSLGKSEKSYNYIVPTGLVSRPNYFIHLSHLRIFFFVSCLFSRFWYSRFLARNG